MDTKVKNKSVYELKYKIYMKIKKENVVKEQECEIVEEIFNKICGKHGIECEMISVKDMLVNVEFSAKPETELLKFITTYKTAVSRKIKSMCGGLVSKDGFWEKGYLLMTVGDEDKKIVSDYIGQ